MIIKPELLNIGGRNLWCKTYRSIVKNDNWLIWLPGIGELGAADGSQIDRVELYDSVTKLPVTWTAQARSGYEFPFNIIAVQLPIGWDYWAIQASIAIYVKETLDATKIGVTGYSLGSRGAWACLLNDAKSYIDFQLDVCGYYDTSQAPISQLRAIPGYSVHGDQDTTMPYSYDFADLTAYNMGKPTQLINGVVEPCNYLVTIKGAGHAVWPIAYDLTPGKDGAYQWVLQQFGVIPPVQIPATLTYNGTDLIATAGDKTWTITKTLIS